MGRSDGADVHACHVTVELRDHIGKHCRTGADVDMNQWIVIVSVDDYFGPKQVGYIHKHPGCELATLRDWNKILRGDRTAVIEAISEAAGWPVKALDYPMR